MSDVENLGDAETISLVYDGGLASRGQLHFYEYGRAAYAFARLVATIEHFRRTGEVAQKIARRNYVDIIIHAPRRGSFPVDILIPIATSVAGDLQKIPLNVLFDYIMHQLKSWLSSDKNTALELAKIQLSSEKERTKQSREETKRMTELRKSVDASNITTQQALRVARDALKSKDRRIAEQDIDQPQIQRLVEVFEEQRDREQRLQAHNRVLRSIEPRALIKLTSKVRPQLGDTGLPLRRSAKKMTLASGRKKHVLAVFDEAEIHEINSRDLEEDESVRYLRIFAFDKDAGFGKCDIESEGLKRMPFSIPPALRRRLRPKILRAMQQDIVRAETRAFRDPGGTVTSIVISDILDPDE